MQTQPQLKVAQLVMVHVENEPAPREMVVCAVEQRAIGFNYFAQSGSRKFRIVCGIDGKWAPFSAH